MKQYSALIGILLSTVTLSAWKSTETKGDKPIFFGTLTTQEGNSFNVTNVTIGHSRDGYEKVVLYEKPKNLAPSKEGNIITVKPAEDLTTTTLELQKVRK